MKNGKRLTVNEIKLIQKSHKELNAADYLRVKRNAGVLTLKHRETNEVVEVTMA